MRRVEAIVCGVAAALVLAAAGPTVGSAAFLSDQVDQIVAFDALVDGEVIALYGPVMSGTDPEAHAFAPVGAVLFGLPSRLGLNPDLLHVLFLLILASGVAFLCWRAAVVDAGTGALWAAILLATPLFWWASGFIWLSTFPFWCGLFVVGGFLGYVTTRRLRYVMLIVAAWLAAMSTQLTATVLWPVLLATAVLLYRDRPWIARGWRPVAAAVALPLLLLVPYTVAELVTGFSNARAILAELSSSSGSATHAEGVTTAFQTLAVALNPFRQPVTLVMDASRGVLVAWFLGLAAAAAAALRWIEGALLADRPVAREVWRALLAVWVVSVAGQVAFYFAMNRPLLGPHYAISLLPLYPVPYVLVASALLGAAWRRRRVALSCGLALVVAFSGVRRSDAAFELSDWNYRTITAALTDITSRRGSVNTIEPGPPFATYSTRADTVLRYLMRHYVPGATLADAPDAVLVPEREGNIEAERVEFAGTSYALDAVVPPGIGVYLRAPAD